LPISKYKAINIVSVLCIHPNPPPSSIQVWPTPFNK
jgi:hypothetical protein